MLNFLYSFSSLIDADVDLLMPNKGLFYTHINELKRKNANEQKMKSASGYEERKQIHRA